MYDKKNEPLEETSTFPTLEFQIRIKKLKIRNWSASNPNCFKHAHNNEISLDPGAFQASDFRTKGVQPIYMSVPKSKRRQKKKKLKTAVVGQPQWDKRETEIQR